MNDASQPRQTLSVFILFSSTLDQPDRVAHIAALCKVPSRAAYTTRQLFPEWHAHLTVASAGAGPAAALEAGNWPTGWRRNGVGARLCRAPASVGETTNKPQYTRRLHGPPGLLNDGGALKNTHWRTPDSRVFGEMLGETASVPREPAILTEQVECDGPTLRIMPARYDEIVSCTLRRTMLPTNAEWEQRCQYAFRERRTALAFGGLEPRQNTSVRALGQDERAC